MTSRVTPLFQPIVDLVAAEPIGYEVLSRGTPPRGAPEVMFADARSEGRLWELERSCRLAAVRAIAQLPRALRRCRYFLNVSPDVFEDPRFVEGFTLGALVEHGLDQNSIVLEITEKASINDHSRFERIIRHYVDQGFQFAVDDFGSGHSSLITLMTCAPRFIKLDMALVRDIQVDPYRQHLVRALVQFAAAVETRLVVEGVETWEELETLVRLGARYAQGFLFGRPAPEPSPLDDAVLEGLDGATSIAERKLVDVDETILPLVSRPTTLPARRHTVEELEALFRRSPAIDHVVVLEDSSPVGIVTRGHIGGDDFVLVCPLGIRVDALQRACDAFDREREALFEPEDLSRRSFESQDRKGERVETPLVTMSLAVVERTHLPDHVHPALLSQLAASLKTKVKERTAQVGRSSFMLERRMPLRAATKPPLRDASGE